MARFAAFDNFLFNTDYIIKAEECYPGPAPGKRVVLYLRPLVPDGSWEEGIHAVTLSENYTLTDVLLMLNGDL